MGKKKANLDWKDVVKIQEHYKSNPCTYAQLQQWISQECKVTIHEKSIGRLLKREIDADALRVCPNRKRRRSVKYPHVDRELYRWVQQYQEAVPLSDELVIDKGKQIAEEHGESSLQISDEWLEKWKKRYGIKKYKSRGKSGMVGNDVVEQDLPDLLAKIREYTPEDVFNMNATGLFFRIEPNSTLVSNLTSALARQKLTGVKKEKEHLSVVVCANADGSEKMRLVVIGKDETPPCFGEINKENLGVTWRWNSNAWITGILFREWLRNIDESMRLVGRKILLLVNNCPAHSIGDLELSNIEVYFFPPYTTQPMDAGIIKALKTEYRTRYFQWKFQALENTNGPDAVLPELTVLEAIDFLKEAWGAVSSDTVRTSWHRVGLVWNQQDILDADRDISTVEADSNNDRLQLRQKKHENRQDISDADHDITAVGADSNNDRLQLKQEMHEEERSVAMVGYTDQVAIEPVIHHEDEEEVCKALAVQQSSNLSNNEETKDISNDEEEEKVMPTISHKQMEECLETARLYLLQQDREVEDGIDQLTGLLKDVRSWKQQRMRQSSLTDYFK